MEKKLQEIINRARESLVEWQLSDFGVPENILTGHILKIATKENSGLFIALETVNCETLVLAALSPIINQACSWDIIVPVEESPVGVPFIIEIWNRISLAEKDNISSCLGRVSDRACHAVAELYIEWIKKGEGKKEKFGRLIGCELAEGYDERREFQEEEIVRVQYIVRSVELEQRRMAFRSKFEVITFELNLKEKTLNYWSSPEWSQRIVANRGPQGNASKECEIHRTYDRFDVALKVAYRIGEKSANIRVQITGTEFSTLSQPMRAEVIRKGGSKYEKSKLLVPVTGENNTGRVDFTDVTKGDYVLKIILEKNPLMEFGFSIVERKM